MAILTPEVDAVNQIHNEIRIYESKTRDPRDLLTSINQKDMVCRFAEDDKNQRDLKFIKTLCFDNNNRKLIGWGDTEFLVLDIKTNRHLLYSIQ